MCSRFFESRVALLVAILMLLAVRPARATWSIVLVDTATGEVAIGSATCLTGFDLRRLLPVVVVNTGAAAAQSAIDTTGVNRKKIWDAFHDGMQPDDIIDFVKQGDPFKAGRQYGIVDLSPAAAGFTGNGVLQFKEDRQGAFGTITYSIQGNVLAGVPVIDMAQAAVVGTEGTLLDKLMAGMFAAHVAGGDGRCSCDLGGPQACGSPPVGFDPETDKSAHIGFMIVARPGDVDGDCTPTFGCADGDYWFNVNFPAQSLLSPDPTVQLQAAYEQFLGDMDGRPDGLMSTVDLDQPDVLPDGETVRTLLLTLRDLDGDPITTGGALVEVEHELHSAGLAEVLGVEDHGNGTYTIRVQAGAELGTDRFSIRIDDGGGSVATVFPYPELEHREPLVIDGPASLSSAQGGAVLFDLLGPVDLAGRRLLLAVSADGPGAGIPLPGGAVLPLLSDRLFASLPVLIATGTLSGSPGSLDPQARSRASIGIGPGGLMSLIGLQLRAAWITLRPADFASNPVLFEIRP